MDTLEERRENLCLKFAIRSSNNEKTARMFPPTQKLHNVVTSKAEKFKVQFAKTESLKNCAHINMQNAINELEEKWKIGTKSEVQNR